MSDKVQVTFDESLDKPLGDTLADVRDKPRHNILDKDLRNIRDNPRQNTLRNPQQNIQSEGSRDTREEGREPREEGREPQEEGELTESSVQRIVKKVFDNQTDSVKRVGDYYVIRMDKDDDPTEDKLEKDYLLEKFRNDVIRESMITGFKSQILRLLNVFSSISVTILGIVIGVLALNSGCDLTSNAYIAAVLGFVITGISALSALFNLEKRGVLLRDISNRLAQLSRKVRELQKRKELSEEDKNRLLEDLYSEMENLDLLAFDSSILSLPPKSSSNV